MLKGAGWLTSANALLFPMMIAQGALTARLLGTSGYGVLAIGLSFNMVVSGFLSFRMQELVVKWVTQLREADGAAASTAFRAGMAADTAASLVAFALVEVLAGWVATVFAKNSEMAGPFRLLGLMLVLQCGRESSLGIMSLNRQFKLQAVIQIVAQSVALIGVLVAFLLHADLYGVVAALLAAEAVRSGLLWVLGARAAGQALGHGWLRTPLSRLGGFGREMVRFAAFTNLGGTLGTLSKQGDALILGLLLNPVSAGYYKLAHSIVQLAVFPVMPLATVTYPELSHAVATESWSAFRQHVRRGAKVAAVLVIPVAVALGVAAPALISLVYGPDFVPAASALAILLVGYTVDGMLFWDRGAMLALGRPGYLARMSLVSAIIKLGLAFALVPLGGYLFMAVAASVALITTQSLIARKTLSSVRAIEAAP